jgi:hypothetical protein
VFGEPLVDVTRRQHRRVDQLDYAHRVW